MALTIESTDIIEETATILATDEPDPEETEEETEGEEAESTEEA